MRHIPDYLTPEICAQLRRAVEIGKWPDGSRLDAEQREICLRAVLFYEAHTLPPEQRTGYIERGGGQGPCEPGVSSDSAPLIAREPGTGER